MSAVENIKEVADLIKKFNDIDLNRKILTLENEVIDLTRDKRRLEESVEELTKKLKFKEELVFKEPFLWRAGDKTPYCPACFELKHEAVHVVYAGQYSGESNWNCPACKNSYDVDSGNQAFRR